MKNIVILAAVAALTMTVAFAPQAAQARDGEIAAGVIGGLAVGAIVGSQVNRNDDGYYRTRAYARECYIERRDFEDRYGRIHVRNVRVCN
jgi:opacity protein-like surface antigen